MPWHLRRSRGAAFTPLQRRNVVVAEIWNIGTEPLRLLCCCAPGYEHTDTILTEG